MSDILHMAHVCEGTVYSEEISKQYLESIKTVKQVDAINQHQRSNSQGRDRGGGHGGQGQSQSQHRSQSKGRPSGNCFNCGSSHPPKRCKAFGEGCYHCHRKGHFPQYCRSKQHGHSHPNQNLMVPDNHAMIYMT